MFRRNNDRHESRTVFLRSEQVTGDPLGAIVDAVWALIVGNCVPRPAGPKRYSEAREMSPVRDVSVQTFYVVYPVRPEYADSLGRLSGSEVAEEILRRLITADNNIFEPYLINKITQSTWNSATTTEARVTAARNIFDLGLLTHTPAGGAAPRLTNSSY